MRRNIRSYTVPKISDILLRTSVEPSTSSIPRCIFQEMTGIGLGSGSRKTDRRYHRCGGDARLVTSPFFLIIAFLIWNTDKGPIFYTQERLTKDRKDLPDL